jgi:integrase
VVADWLPTDTFGGRISVVPEGMNPARKIEKYPEERRERFLTNEELERLGTAIREAETTGIPWEVDESAPNAKHIAKAEKRFTKIDQYAASALRLLLLSGCRLREILHLQWDHVDIERGLLFLSDSKTGRKTVVLNAPALSILAALPHAGIYVIAGNTAGKPRADLKRPWQTIAKHAGLQCVRLHDLRHTFASVGAGGGLGLPIIGKLLGHTQASTTHRYAHLDNDPVRRGSEQIGNAIAAAMGEPVRKASAEVIELKRR